MNNQSRLNVVFIVGDNVGWGDIGCYGGLAPTPRIDRLAGEGLRFKNYDVPDPPPTRARPIRKVRNLDEGQPLFHPAWVMRSHPSGHTVWAKCSESSGRRPTQAKDIMRGAGRATFAAILQTWRA